MTQQERKKVSKANELPSHSYAVEGSLSQLLPSADSLRPSAESVGADLQQNLTDYLIEDRATLRAYFRTLLQIAMLDSRFDEAVRYVDSVKALEDKESALLMCGAMESAVIAAGNASARDEAAFSSAFAATLAGLPFAKVASELKAQKRRLEILSPELYLGVVEEQLDAAIVDGRASLDIMRRVIEFAYLIRVVLPFRDCALACLTKMLDANRTSQVDIWPERDAVLENDALTPVVMGIWDTGTDLSLFADHVPGDVDAASIGWTWDSTPSAGFLRPITLAPHESEEAKLFTKGSSDMRADIDSPEASALRRKLSALSATK